MLDPAHDALLLFIKKAFNLEELKTLCFNLYLQFDDIAGQTLEAKARELIAYMERIGRLRDLMAALARERPEQFRDAFGYMALRPARSKIYTRNSRQVFISHAHQDTEFAHRLADDLRRKNFEIWIAPESIQLGELWVEGINRGLRESGIFLLVSTPNAIDSEWVRGETSYAIELATKQSLRFILVDLEEADVPPLWMVRQHVSFRSDYFSGLQQLLTALQASTEANDPEVLELLPKPLGPILGNKIYWLLGLLAIVIVVFLAWRLVDGSLGGKENDEPTSESTAVTNIASTRSEIQTPAATTTVRPTVMATWTPESTIFPTPSRTPTVEPSATAPPLNLTVLSSPTATSSPLNAAVYYPGVTAHFALVGPLSESTRILDVEQGNPAVLKNENLFTEPYTIPVGTLVYIFAAIEVPDPVVYGNCENSCFGRLTLYKNGDKVLDNAPMWDYHPWGFGAYLYAFDQAGEYSALVYFCDIKKFDCLSGAGWQGLLSRNIRVTEP